MIHFARANCEDFFVAAKATKKRGSYHNHLVKVSLETVFPALPGQAAVLTVARAGLPGELLPFREDIVAYR